MAKNGRTRKGEKAAKTPPKPQSGQDRASDAKVRAAEARAAEARAEARESEAEAKRANEDARPAGMAEGLSAAALGLSKLLADGGAGGVSPKLTDAITQALVLVLGSGPSIVALDGMMAVQAANGMMYYNAVANQQKTNMLGMAMTAKCVRHMLNSDRDDGLEETIFEDEAQE